jgi:hypothetical protein
MMKDSTYRTYQPPPYTVNAPAAAEDFVCLLLLIVDIAAGMSPHARHTPCRPEQRGTKKKEREALLRFLIVLVYCTGYALYRLVLVVLT